MEDKEYYEDYKIGEKFVSPGKTITEADIINFAADTGDWHPLHTDIEYAKKSAFKERIAHGLLTLVIGNSLGLRLGQYVMVPKSFIAFYGIDKLRFVGPVKIGDTIRLEWQVADLTAKDNSKGVLTYDCKIKNQRNEDVAIYTAKYFVARRP